MVLSDSLPMLEHMGVRVMGEDNFRIRQGNGGDGVLVSMHDFKLEAPVSDELEPEALARLFEGTFAPGLPRRGRERRLQPPGAARRPGR